VVLQLARERVAGASRRAGRRRRARRAALVVGRATDGGLGDGGWATSADSTSNGPIR
jgi:hypothetical protein